MFIHAVHKNLVMDLTQNMSGSICCHTCRERMVMLMGLRTCSWTAGTTGGKWKAGIWQSDAAKKGEKKIQAHIKLLNMEETSVGSLRSQYPSESSGLCCAKSQIYKGSRHLPWYWL